MSRIAASGVCTAVLILIFASLATRLAVAETKTVTPQGEFAQIDTRRVNETIKVLTQGSAKDKRAAIARIKARPEDYAPPVFYALSNVLFADGDKDEAAFWFYAGQLRARVDANICADASARQAVGLLNRHYGTPINRYAFQDMSKLETLIAEVVAWERRTPYHYDRRWINLHGMAAMMSGLGGPSEGESQAALSYPEGQWSEIAEKTRADYLDDFREAVAQMKSRK